MAKTYQLERLRSLDFESWSKLATHEPDTFEAMRLAMIEDLIRSAPPARQQRLRRLQWRIDQERRLSRTPLGACIRISRMMWENLMGDDGLVGHIQQIDTPAANRHFATKPPARTAAIIPFRSRRPN